MSNGPRRPTGRIINLDELGDSLYDDDRWVEPPKKEGDDKTEHEVTGE